MDPFDDFEMKPLTEGLGFHRKAIQLNDAAKKAGQPPQRSSLADLSLDASLDYKKEYPAESIPMQKTYHSEPELPLPPRARDSEKIPAMEPRWQQPVNSDFMSKTQRGAADSPRVQGWQKTPVSLSSSILDGVVVFAVSLLFLASLLAVTNVDFSLVYRNLLNDVMTQICFAVLYIAVLEIYVVLSRSFCGKTLGEWTFDCQMGSDDQIQSSFYPLLIVWRSLVILLTGVVVIPLLSFIVRVDLASYLTGLQLYKKRI